MKAPNTCRATALAWGIKKTVQKYDGVYSLRLAQPGRFVVDLLLPIDAAAPVEQVFVWESAKEALV